MDTSDTSPVILRLHPELDADQRTVIAHGDGPLLVIAGPGSGKTLCLQLRAVNLLLTGQCLSGELVLCTFGRNAARRLEQRFLRSARDCGVPGDLSRVRISTVHSLCHRILAPHAGAAGLRPGYRLLDEPEQQLLMQEEFDAVLGPDWDTLARRGWREGIHGAAEAARYMDRICDELIDAEVLAGSERPFLAAVGRSCRRYRQLLRERNLADFSHLQVWAHRVLQDDDIAAAIGGDIRHLMVDEYQDVSRVQMGILQRLAGAHGNVTAVGDDDQAIHRFRGASVASILEFPRTGSPAAGCWGSPPTTAPTRISSHPQAGGWTPLPSGRSTADLTAMPRVCCPTGPRPTRFIPPSSRCRAGTPWTRPDSWRPCSSS